ncbi:HAD family phosphatase [Dactylosporangium fulvum]|uniref:HAD family phosphatase n=1 Tax=Dactylosporangium fulvum TaxID=53359 RepID=A0ABY5WC48_9ACTN|nr:HAD family phosphatase [Dactylosporangium fulvum]UWP86701.1 HAD family phosphatase [Dactylosporangium fulvum]
MPDVVLFDLFGVIARRQSPAAKRTVAATVGVPAPAFWDVYWRLRAPYDLGQITGAEYWRWVATALGTVFDEDRVTALIAADVASWSAIDDDMVALIERTAAAGVRLALLSNIPEDLAAYYERHHGRWLRHFDLVAFSCRIGRAKPDADAYLWCCRELGLAPDRVLFIDDRAENVYAAERLGLHTHLFTGPAETAQVIDATRPQPEPDGRRA